MIVSCHIPKTAGTTFGKLLRLQLGRGLRVDYGDRVGWTGPAADEWRRARGVPAAVAAAHSRGRLRAVHGHFYASKYADTYAEADFVAFVREPVARVVSNYQYLAEHPKIDHPLVAEFHAAKPGLTQWAEWPCARNLQSSLLDIPLERFALIGVTEQFDRSLRTIDQMFGMSLATLDPTTRHNVSVEPIAVDTDTAARVAALNEADVELYQRVVTRFERQAVASIRSARR